MKLKTALRGLLLDWLAERDDRYYWRQAMGSAKPAHGATFCLWQPDGKLGDSVIHTALVHSLAMHRPDMKIVIVCAPGLVGFWQRIPGVHAVIGAANAKDAAQHLQGAHLRIDVLVSLEAFLSLDTVRFIRTVRPATCIGLNTGRYRVFTHAIADNTYDHPRRHVTQRLRHLCELLEVPHVAASGLPSVALDGRTARVTLPEGIPHVFLNVYGAGAQKAFNDDTVSWLIQQIRACQAQAHILLNVPTHERARFQAHAAAAPANKVSLTPESMDLWELIALMRQCAAVVTPDTGIGHIAAALQQPLMVFFEDTHYTPVVWAPDTPGLHKVTPVQSGHINTFDRSLAQQSLDDMMRALTAF